MTKQGLLKGTIVLTLAAFITKVLGFINSIVMARVLGSEGIGLVMMAIPVMGLVITLTTLGLNVAVSKFVAEADVHNDQQKVRRILYVSLITTGTLSIIFTIFTLLGAKVLSSVFLTDQRSYYSLVAVTPVVPIIAISAVIKGYFRGKQNMNPIAFSQVFEQIIRISCIYFFVSWLLPYGIEFAAAGAVISAVTGEFFSMLYLLAIFKRQKPKGFKLFRSFTGSFDKGKETLFNLMYIGLPTTGSNLIYSISGIIQPIVITQSLAIAGLSVIESTKQYGMLTGFAMPLVFFPGFIMHSLSTALIPDISAAYVQNKHTLIQRRIQQSFRLALLVGVPSSTILYIFAVPLTTVIYKSAEAGLLLQTIALFFLFHYFSSPLQAILIGLGKAKAAMFNHLFGTVIKFVTIFTLASNPSFGIYGVALGICSSVCLVTFLHFFSVSKLVGFYLNSIDFVKTIGAGVMMGGTGYYVYDYLEKQDISQISLLIISIPLSLLIYLILIVLFKMLGRQDIIRVPYIGSKIAFLFPKR